MFFLGISTYTEINFREYIQKITLKDALKFSKKKVIY